MLTGVIECSEECEQNTGVNDALSEVGGDDIGVVLPFRVMESQERD